MPDDGNIHPIRLLNQPAHKTTLEQLEALAKDERLNDVFRRACQREVTRAEASRRDFESRRGVCWSGMDPDPYRVRSVGEIAADAEAELARRNSPRARFFAALSAAEEVDPVRASQVRAEFNRSAGEDAESIEPRCAGACIALLNQIPGRGARDCLDAIAEMLMRRAAA